VTEAAFAEFAGRKPEPERSVAELPGDEPLAAHAVEDGQQAGYEPLLGRDAGGGVRRIKLFPEGSEFLEHDVGVALDGPQRRIWRDGDVEVQDGEEDGLRLRLRLTAQYLSDALSAQISALLFLTAC
jgi:hypothetical protein